MRKQIEEKIKKYELEMKEALKSLVRINSTEDLETSDKNKPFGDGVREAMDYIIEMSKKDSMNYRDFEGFALDIRTDERDEEYIAVVCHIDTVPANPEKWIQNPWEPLEQDGFIFGRGTQDDKGPLVAVYYALKIIKELNIKLNKPVRLIIGGNEESGYKGVTKYFKLNKQPIAAFTADNAFPGINNEKGGARGDLEFEFKDSTIISFNGGATINIVPDLAEAEIDFDLMEASIPFFEYLEKNNLEGSIDAQGKNTLVSIKGTPAHGSIPSQGVNAITHLANFLFELTNNDLMKLIVDNFHNKFNGEELGIQAKNNEFGTTTINPGILKTKNKKLILSIDIRFPYGITSKTLNKKIIDKFKDANFSLSKVDEPLYIKPESPLVSTLYSTYQEFTGDYDSQLITSGGGTYAKVTNNCMAFGGLFPNSEWRMHAIDERVLWKEILKQTEIYIHAIIKLTNIKW
ncbi:MAG: Sapep family Mn(2+)-dependent dipeptidase [Mycoplasmatales bacterium]|nr:Sapep family Mn(2+)-dependent dipeptidase [Mycoplasmatales bacterium]